MDDRHAKNVLINNYVMQQQHLQKQQALLLQQQQLQVQSYLQQHQQLQQQYGRASQQQSHQVHHAHNAHIQQNAPQMTPYIRTQQPTPPQHQQVNRHVSQQPAQQPRAASQPPQQSPQPVQKPAPQPVQKLDPSYKLPQPQPSRVRQVRAPVQQDVAIDPQTAKTIVEHTQNLIREAQQQQQQQPQPKPQGVLKSVELPDQQTLEDFKTQVRLWIEIDNCITKLKKAIKERNVVKKQLTDKILMFMAKYNIEDLNTKDGSRLRFKVSQVKQPLTAKAIRDKLTENFENIKSLEELEEQVFTTAKVEKVSLRRLKKRTLEI